MNAAKVQITVSLVVYAATMAFALAQGWRANDLVWGIWISGVVVTLYAAAAVPLFQMTRRHADAENENWAIRAVQAIGNSFVNLGAFGLLGVPLLFGATGLMLNSFSPLLARSAFESQGGTFFGLFMLADEALGRFWPLAVSSCVVCSSSLIHASANSRQDQDSQVASLVATIEAIRAAAVAVVAMLVHLALGAITKTGATIANYLLLSLLLFPWMSLVQWSGQGARGASGREKIRRQDGR